MDVKARSVPSEEISPLCSLSGISSLSQAHTGYAHTLSLMFVKGDGHKLVDSCKHVAQ